MHDRDLVDVERLGEVVVGALLHRGDRDALAAVRGEQDDRQRRIALRRSGAISSRPSMPGIERSVSDGVGLVELGQRLGAGARGDARGGRAR